MLFTEDDQGDEWIAVDLMSVYTVTSIITQGCPSSGEWVATFYVAYSNKDYISDDNDDWTYIYDAETRDKMVSV